MYNYQTEKQGLFTESGQTMFLAVRDRVKAMLDEAGAVRAAEAWKGVCGDSWMMLACLDRLIELKEIREITDSRTMGQHRVFVSTRN